METPLDQPAGPLGRWPCVGRARTVADLLGWIGKPEAATVLVRSPLGGGKTRVLEETITRLGLIGRPAHRIVATSATATVPFGAVAHYLPAAAADTRDPVALIAMLRDTFTAPGPAVAGRKPGRPVVVLDDAPHLDATTAAALASLTHTGLVDIVAAARSEELLPDPLIDVLLGDRSLLVELNPLSEDDIDTLLHLALGGPVDRAATWFLRDRTGGNPLYLRELTRSAVEAESLAPAAGVWRLRGDPPASTRLGDVVATRLNALTPEALSVLQLLALCDEAELDELESMAPLADLVALEGRGLLKVVDTSAVLSHPLHGQALSERLAPMQRRLLLRRHLQWLEEQRPAAARPPLQYALWRLDAGLPTSLEVLMAGADLAAAAGDARSTIRLARPVFDQAPTAESGWRLGDGLFKAGEWTEALAVIERTIDLPMTISRRADLALLRSTILLWGMGDAAGAVAGLAALRDDPACPPEDAARLQAEIASIMVNTGRPGEALELLEGALATGGPATRRQATVTHVTALTMAGRTAQAMAAADAALALPPVLALGGGPTVETIQVARTLALVESGRLDEAAALASRGYEHAAAHRRPLVQFWYSLVEGRAHLLAGKAVSAQRCFARARAIGTDSGFGGVVRIAIVGLVVSAALLGDAEAAASGLAEMERLAAFGFFDAEVALAEGWRLAAAGQLAEGRAALLDGVDAAADLGYVTSAIWLLHDAARMGAAAQAVDRIEALAAATESPFTRAGAQHVRAIVDRDADGLVDVADRFEAMGAPLFAAEALAAAADLRRDSQDRRATAALAHRVDQLVERCEGARSPLIVTTTHAVDPLSEREREIALLAANGYTGRQIAEQLFVSYRTVNNHLQHIYDKIGVRGRAELRRALGLDEGAR